MRGAGRCEALYVAHVRFYENDRRFCEPGTVERIVIEIGSPQAPIFFYGHFSLIVRHIG